MDGEGDAVSHLVVVLEIGWRIRYHSCVPQECDSIGALFPQKIHGISYSRYETRSSSLGYAYYTSFVPLT